MKTDEGWVRGHNCGKPWIASGLKFVCAFCGRTSDEKADLCYPTEQ